MRRRSRHLPKKSSTTDSLNEENNSTQHSTTDDVSEEENPSERETTYTGKSRKESGTYDVDLSYIPQLNPGQ